MNEENKNGKLNDQPDEFESLLKSMSPVRSSGLDAEKSDGQLMYAMGHAAGLAEAGGHPALKSPSTGTRNGASRFWQLSTAVSTILAASFAMLLFSQTPNLSSGQATVVEGAGALDSDASDSSATSAESLRGVDDSLMAENIELRDRKINSSRIAKQPSGLRRLFVAPERGSSIVRRDQILAAAGSADLDRTLEQIESSVAARKPQRRISAGPSSSSANQSTSPFASVREMLESNEF